MDKDWAKLAGDEGRPVKKSKLGRALKLGGLATRVSGSFLRRQVKRLASGKDEDSMTGAALDNVRQIVDVMGEMKGAAMKIGQMLSADPDIVNSDFAQRLATLQRSAPPMDYESLSNQIETALDLPMQSIFSYFDPDPIGSASIGQVHKARLADGREVAVKVQYPGVIDSIDSDMKNLRHLLRLGRMYITPAKADEFTAEARRSIMAESDYRIEAANLERFGKLFEDWEHIRIPKPVPEYTRRTLLMMDFIDGVPFDDAVNAIESADVRNRLATHFIEAFVYMFHDWNALHADPHPGNFMLDHDGKIVLLDFGCIREFRPELADGVLKMLRAVMDDDFHRLTELYGEYGFGQSEYELPSTEVLRDYHAIILEPMLHDGPFRFKDYAMHSRARDFVLKHRDMLRMTPPAELLLYFRVLAGLKGMMTRTDASVHLRAIAEACQKRRGI